MQDIEQILELQRQRISEKQIINMFGGTKAFNRIIKKYDYKRDDTTGQYIPRSTVSSTNDSTDSTTQISTKSSTSEAMDKQEMQILGNELIDTLTNEQGTLIEMIQWFKTYKQTTTGDIVIELPVSENVMTSCRANKVIWDQFGEFAKNNRTFSKGDLLSQALIEFMNKYK